MSTPTLVFSPDALRDGVTQVFVHAGVPDATAAMVADHLLDAEMCGVRSHGLIRVPQYLEVIVEGIVNLHGELTVTRESGATVVLDGQNGFGPVMALQAMDHAIERSERHGIGAATLVNCSHTGRLAAYTQHAAAAGKIGFMCVNAGGHGQWVAPFGGMVGRLGTNPLSFALPRPGGDPLVLDIATSTVPEGKVRATKNAGKEMPPGWVCDHKGQPSSDPDALYGPPRGAILPLGAHKGFGLSLIVDLLAGALSGAGVCSDPDAPLGGATDGVFLLAVSVESFCPLETFAALAGNLIAHIKTATLAPGFDEILFPGESEARCRRDSLENGVAIDALSWEPIASALSEHGVELEPMG